MNLEHAKAHCLFVFLRGLEDGHATQYPVAPHLFYGSMLSDTDPAQRKAGMEAGQMLMERCEEIWTFHQCIVNIAKDKPMAEPPTSGMEADYKYATNIARIYEGQDIFFFFCGEGIYYYTENDNGGKWRLDINNGELVSWPDKKERKVFRSGE